jgi:hypothetical protein
MSSKGQIDQFRRDGFVTVPAAAPALGAPGDR